MKIAIIAGFAPSIINFRKSLILELMKQAEVAVFVPYEDEATLQAILNLGVKHYFTKFRPTGLNPLHDLKAMLHLLQQLKAFAPDYVLSYTIKAVIWGSIAARLAGVRKIYTMITGLGYAFTDLSNAKRRLIHKVAVLLYRYSLRNSKMVFFQNPEDLALFQQLNIIPAAKPTIILNGSGVDLDYYAASAPNVFPLRFLMVARLLKDKGIYEYLQAAEQTKLLYPDVEFHLVGWTDDNPSAISSSMLQDYIEKKKIIFHGKLMDVRPVLALSSVFVLPSHREGTPRSVLEAMSAGRAIITTDAPGCKETVRNGFNGYLVPIKNVAALVQAMLKFIENPALISQMGYNSRAFVEKKYDVLQVNRVILSNMGFEKPTQPHQIFES